MSRTTLAPSLIASIRSQLLAHYDACARHLPWRATSDPYAIWISEVMSQQTRVETVIPYWEAWLEKFPTVEALAAAEQDDVLKSWEGLGYYSRARNLHAGAAVVCERYAGRLPSSSAEMIDIPGIGPYTAGAIASIAFGEAVPAIDGNVRRVFARLFDIPDPTPAQLSEFGQALVDPDRPGDFNQAVMELGATICSPRSPRCEECPIMASCAAYRAGTVNERPARKKKAPAPEGVFLTTVLLREPGRKPGHSEGPKVLLVRRGPGLLEGMWSFPDVRVDDSRDADSRDSDADAEAVGEVQAHRLAAAHLVEAVDRPRLLGEVDHVFSHLRATYRVTLLLVQPKDEDRAGQAPGDDDVAWASLDQIQDLPLPTGQRRILALLHRHLSD